MFTIIELTTLFIPFIHLIRSIDISANICEGISVLNSNHQNLVFIEIAPGVSGNNLYEFIYNIIDNQLENNTSCFYFVSFTYGSKYKMIVQKYHDNKYASYILFGYSQSQIIFGRKIDGVWS